MCIAIVYQPSCNIINFKIKLFFLIISIKHAAAHFAAFFIKIICIVQIIHHIYTWQYIHTNINPYTLFLQHVYMRPEVNSNRFEISLRGKILLRCKVTSLLAFTWVQANWTSLRCKFHWPKWSFKPQWVFHVNSKCPQRNKVAQNHFS